MNKRYKKYKLTGVEWLPEIPVGWEVRRLKSITNYTVNGVWGDDPKGNGDDIACLRVADFDMSILGVSTAKLTYRNVAANQRNDRLFKRGDLLIEKSGGGENQTVGRCVRFNLDIEAVCSNFVGKIDLRLEEANADFVAYYFDALYRKRINTKAIKQTTGIQNLDLDSYLQEPISLPSLAEQRIIARFLDDKVAQIDQLITQKRQMMELLQEERAAFINHAVTKGLDTAAPMRDSGIEWLGEVPAHWEILPIKRVAHLKYGLGQPPRQMDGGLPIVRATNVFRGEIDEKGMMYVDPDDIPYERDPVLKLNDIIVVRSGAYTADSAIVTEKYVGAIAGYDMVLRPVAVNPQFIAYALLSNYLLINQLYAHRLRAAQPHLNTEELGESFLVKPPRGEQEMIVKYLRDKTAHIQATTLTINEEIALLQEYRAALIAEAVTGQIDVRDYEPVAQEALL